MVLVELQNLKSNIIIKTLPRGAFLVDFALCILLQIIVERSSKYLIWSLIFFLQLNHFNSKLVPNYFFFKRKEFNWKIKNQSKNIMQINDDIEFHIKKFIFAFYFFQLIGD